MSGCSFTQVENKETEEIKYTDALAEQFAAEVGVDPRPNETLVEIDERGAFIRQPNAFIQPFGDKEGDLKAEANRFGIYWATGCNWSNRPIIVRELLGLQDVISETRVSPSGETNRYGHAFGQYPDFKDPATGAYFLSEFYKRANPDFKGRATTPTLVDVKEKKAVNNDYHRLTNYLEVQFRPFQPKDAPDLYPKKFRKEIDEFNDWLFPHVNNGHYRMAFCQSPEAYDEAYEDFYESLDKLDKRLKELYAIPAFRHGSDPQVLALSRPGKKLGEVLFRGYNERILAKVDFEKLMADDGSRRTLSKTPVSYTHLTLPTKA